MLCLVLVPSFALYGSYLSNIIAFISGIFLYIEIFPWLISYIVRSLCLLFSFVQSLLCSASLKFLIYYTFSSILASNSLILSLSLSISSFFISINFIKFYVSCWEFLIGAFTDFVSANTISASCLMFLTSFTCLIKFSSYGLLLSFDSLFLSLYSAVLEI